LGTLTPTPQKIKQAIITLYDRMILFECPFCGQTLIRTDYSKIKKLMDEEQTVPRGKVCPKCNGVAVLKLSEKAKEEIRARTPSNGLLHPEDATARIVE
jgi:predicted RNA-binding Zn-ribbon protein involved in translation (DUF1610 family)